MIHELRSPLGSYLDLVLALGTPTWSSLQGSHAGYPSQLARPSPLRDGVPLSAPRRRMVNELMRGAWPRGYK
jgi:hypothetical protein